MTVREGDKYGVKKGKVSGKSWILVSFKSCQRLGNVVLTGVSVYSA